MNTSSAGLTKYQEDVARAVIREACEAHHLTRGELMSKRRHAQIVAGRVGVIVALRAIESPYARTGRLFTVEAIAAILGLDHSTVVYHLQQAAVSA